MEQLTFEQEVEKAHALANDSSEAVLMALGFSMGRYGEIKCSCPVHGGDNRYGFSWSPQKKVWKCWTNQCHETYGSNLLGLVRGIKRCSLREAVDFIFNLLGNKIDMSDVERKNFIRKSRSVEKSHEILDKGKLEKMTRDISYFVGRGLNPDLLNKYQCFTCKTNGHPLNNRACIPIFSEKEDLIGFSGRIIDDKLINKDYCPKWKIYPYEMPKEKILFNLNNAKESIRELRSAIVVEGPLDVFKLIESGVPNVVAPLGINLSTDHIKLLVKSGVHNMILALDPDEAGQKNQEKMVKKFAMYFRVFTLDLKKDPGEYTVDEVKAEIVPQLQEIYVQNNFDHG